jgi:hypothetical protein
MADALAVERAASAKRMVEGIRRLVERKRARRKGVK